MKNKFPRGSQEEFERFLVDKYFQFGSVDKVLKKFQFDLPISYAQYQRVLDKFGVIKAVGPNGKFSEAVEFLSQMAHDNLDFEKAKKSLPPSFATSASTLYRILSYVKKGVTRRTGVALLISPFNNHKKILIARDISTPNLQLGKNYGDFSLPMGYSKKSDNRQKNIKRVLQHEVFCKNVVKRDFPEDVVPKDPEPFLYLDIADVRVSVFQISFPRGFDDEKLFSSYKLEKYSFVEMNKILEGKIKTRSGVKEAVAGYRKYLEYQKKDFRVNPLQNKSSINVELAEVVIEIEN